MKRNQFKKLVSTVTVASILGTSAATPFDVLMNPVQAAEGKQTTNNLANIQERSSQQGMNFLYTFRGYSDIIFSTMEVSIENMKAQIATRAVQPHNNFSTMYASMNIQSPVGVNKYTKTIAGTTMLSANTEQVDLSIGDFITTYHREYSGGTGRLKIENTTTKEALATKETIIYMVTADGLVLVSGAEKATIITENKARDAVNGLFENHDPNANIMGNLTQEDINNTKKLIDAVTDTTKKAELQADLNKAQEQLDNNKAEEKAEQERQIAAEKAVNELFQDNDPMTNTIKNTTTEAFIDDAQKAIDAVKDTEKKVELQVQLDKAKELLAEKNEAAAEKAKEEEVEQAVNELFKDNEPATGEIKDIATQQAIDDIQAVIDTMADSAKKDELQANLDKAKELLTEKNEATAEKARQEAAENSIKDLFNDEDVNGTIKETTSQTTIDNAQKAIDAVTDQAKQVELQTQLDKAQAQVDARTAISGNVAAYTEGELYITGTYTGAVTGLSVDVNGKRYYGGDLKDGKVKFYVGDKSLKAGDDIILNLYDASKQIKKSLPVEVIAPLKVAVADYKIGDNYLVATYNNPEIAKVGVIVAGMKYWGGEVKDGNVKFYAIDKIKNPNAEVTMNFYDANNNLLASQPVKVSSTFLEITTANYTIGASNITGTFEGDVKKIAVSINDTKYYGGTLAANGTYKFYALDKKITATDTVIVYGYDANNGLLTQKTVTITE